MFGFAPISSTPISSLPAGAMATFTKIYYTNARLAPVAKTFNTNILTIALNIKTQSTNNFNLATITNTQTVNAYRVITGSKIHGAFAELKLTISKSAIQSGYIIASVNRNISLNILLLQKTTAAQTTDIVKQATISKSTLLSGYIIVSVNRNISLNTLLSKKALAAQTTDIVKQATLISQHQTDNFKQAVFTRTQLTDTILRIAQSRQHYNHLLAQYTGIAENDTDILIRDTNIKSFSVDLRTRSIQPKTTVLTASLNRTIQVTQNIDSYIKEVIQTAQNVYMLKYISITLGHLSNSALKSAILKYQLINMQLKQSLLKTHTISLYKVLRYLKVTSVNSKLINTSIKSNKSNSKLYSTTSGYNNSDVFIKRLGIRIITTNAKFIALKTKTYLTRSFLKSSNVLQSAASTFIKKRNIFSHSVSALKISVKIKFHNVSAKIVNKVLLQHQTVGFIKARKTLQHSMLSSLFGTVRKDTKANLLKKISNVKTVTTRSYIKLRTTIYFFLRGYNIKSQIRIMTLRSMFIKLSSRSITANVLVRKRSLILTTLSAYKVNAYIKTQKSNVFKILTVLKSHGSISLTKALLFRSLNTSAMIYNRGVIAQSIASSGIKTLDMISLVDLLKIDSTNPKHKTSLYKKDAAKLNVNTNLLSLGKYIRNISVNALIDNDAPNGYFDSAIFADSYWEVSVF